MAVGQTTQTTQVYSSTIVTSDPSTGTVQAVLPGAIRPIMIQGTPIAFRWPVAGEVWRIISINGTFYLDCPLPIQENSSTATMSAQDPDMDTINTIAPGDVVLNSPTGKVWVLGDATGSNDFSFGRTSYTYAPAVAPSPPSAGFTVYVDEADGKLKAISSAGHVTTLANP